jgi:hypothetical protein
MSVVQTERARPAPVPVPLHGLRLLPAPSSEPPYDDERPGGRPLPLRPAGLQALPPLRLVPPPSELPAEPVADPTTPSARPFAHALVQRLLEVLAGVRPVAQLKRDTSLGVYDDLERMVTVRPRPTGTRPDRRSVRSVHVQVQPGGVAEVFATVRRSGRYGAVALRLEHTSGSWRCTALEGA